MCAPGWQLGYGNSPGFRLTPPNPDWAGKSPPEPLPLLYPVFCPSSSGIVRFSCLAAARGAQDSRGMQPGLESLHPGPVPTSLHPGSLLPAFSLAGISLCSATPWQAPAEVTGAASCRNPAEKPKCPQNPTRTRSHTRHRGTGRSSASRGRNSHTNTKLLSLSPLPCLDGNILPGNEF